MSENDPDSKTEEPTGKKLSDAQEKGNVIQSKDLSSLMMLFAATMLIAFGGPALLQYIMGWSKTFIENSHLILLNTDMFREFMLDGILVLGLLLAIPLFVFLLTGVASSVLLHGLIFTSEPLQPKLERIDPIQGFFRVFSMRMVVETLKGIVKMTIVGVIVFYLLLPELEDVERYVSSSIVDSMDNFFWLLIYLMSAVTAVMVVIALVDYLYARYEYYKNLRMTKQEVKEEYKNQEGDPHVKARLKQLRQEKVRKRMMAAVPSATVVVTNPTHYAVALKYDQDSMGAPVVVAKGVDTVAKRIRDLAYENFVPVVENPPLARNLYSLVELDDEVPPDLYKATAEVIGFVMRLKRSAVR
jgi:flagellar biosynthetic protein FlhB